MAPFRLTLLMAIILMVLESAAVLATPWFAGHFAEGLLTGDAPEIAGGSQATLLGLWLLVFVSQALLRFSSAAQAR